MPSSSNTFEYGINNLGQIAGNYVESNGIRGHGFPYRDGAFTTIDAGLQSRAALSFVFITRYPGPPLWESHDRCAFSFCRAFLRLARFSPLGRWEAVTVWPNGLKEVCRPRQRAPPRC